MATQMHAQYSHMDTAKQASGSLENIQTRALLHDMHTIHRIKQIMKAFEYIHTFHLINAAIEYMQ